MDCFMRRFWQVLAMIAALAVGTMVMLAIIAPNTYDLVMWRLVRASQVPLYYLGCMAVVIGVFRAMFGKKGG